MIPGTSKSKDKQVLYLAKIDKTRGFQEILNDIMVKTDLAIDPGNRIGYRQNYGRVPLIN